MTNALQARTACNPFRYLDLWDLEKLFKQADEMEDTTKMLVSEALQEKRAAEENYEPLGRIHNHFVKHVS